MRNTKEYYMDLAKYHMYIGAVHLGTAFYNIAKFGKEFNTTDTFDWFEVVGIDRNFYHNLEFGDSK